MQKIEFQRQKHDYWCAAACLSMIYNSFGLPLSQEDIFPQISTRDTGLRMGKSAKMVKDAISRGLLSTMFRPRNVTQYYSVFDICFANEISLMVLYRRTMNDSILHYSVISGVDDDDFLILQDPFPPDGANYRMSKDRLLSLMRISKIPGHQSSRDFNFLAFKKASNDKGYHPIPCEKDDTHKIHVINELSSVADYVLCTDCDWYMQAIPIEN